MFFLNVRMGDFLEAGKSRRTLSTMKCEPWWARLCVHKEGWGNRHRLTCQERFVTREWEGRQQVLFSWTHEDCRGRHRPTERTYLPASSSSTRRYSKPNFSWCFTHFTHNMIQHIIWYGVESPHTNTSNPCFLEGHHAFLNNSVHMEYVSQGFFVLFCFHSSLMVSAAVCHALRGTVTAGLTIAGLGVLFLMYYKSVPPPKCHPLPAAEVRPAKHASQGVPVKQTLSPAQTELANKPLTVL